MLEAGWPVEKYVQLSPQTPSCFRPFGTILPTPRRSIAVATIAAKQAAIIHPWVPLPFAPEPGCPRGL
jgi:hypothetical protein